jgi:2-phospho-L-lactate guanylyltransferase
MDTFIAIPVKPFGVAKRRLAPVLDADQRSRVGKAVAAHVIATAQATECPVAVVTGDRGVASWAGELGAGVIHETGPPGLNHAALAAVTEARRHGETWMMLHADLPALTASELQDALDALPRHGILLAPSHNGGTSLIAGDLDTFSFAYGRASFRRHFATVARLPHRVLIRPGLAIDLDGPEDLDTITRLPAGRWLADLIPVAPGRDERPPTSLTRP